MASITKSGKKFRLRWTDDQGKPMSKTLDRREDAEFHARRIEAEKLGRKLGHYAVAIPEMPFSMLCEEWLKTRAPQKRSAHHDKSIISFHLLPHFQSIAIAKINQNSADVYRAQKNHLELKTIHNHLTLLIAMLNWAHQSNWLATPPKIKRPKISTSKEYRFLKSKNEMRLFLESARKHSRETEVFYATALFTGLRAGELVGLMKTKVDLNNRLITVDRSYDGPTKSDRIRYVPILDELLPILSSWLTSNSSRWMFPNSVGHMRQPSDRIFQETFRWVLQDMGYEKSYRRGGERFNLVFHDLRHTFASHWVMGGGNLFKLQKILGHQSIQMTERYSHLNIEAYKSDHHLLSGVIKQNTDSDCRLKILRTDQCI